MILVGTGGQASLEQHTGKSKCRQNAKRNEQARGLRTLFDVGLTRRAAGPVLQPLQIHTPPLVQADLIPEVVELDLLDDDMNTPESGELGDAHTIALPDAGLTAGQETCPADQITDVDAADAAAATQATRPADLECDIIDVDAAGDINLPAKPSQSLVSTPSAPLKQVCHGLHIPVPTQMTPYTAYPFGLHEHSVLPWIIHIDNKGLHLQSTGCRGSTSSGQPCCFVCQELQSNKTLEGILNRMENGVHENAPYAYQPIAGLRKILERKNSSLDLMRVGKMNAARKLKGKLGVLDEQKKLLMAVAYGGVNQIDALLRAGFRNRAGAQGMMKLVDRAMLGLYKPKNFTEEEMLRNLLFLKLGGSRVAEIAHRALGGPGVSTLRRHSVNRPLRAVSSFPTAADICYNLDASFSVSGQEGTSDNATGYILMFDEIAVERRPRWDDASNQFLGVCREHGQSLGLEFCSLEEVEALCAAVGRNEVHLASEVRPQCSISGFSLPTVASL